MYFPLHQMFLISLFYTINNMSVNRLLNITYQRNNNAITYWRLSSTAKEFFDLTHNIFEHWNEYRKLLKFPDEVASTDLVYAMAAQIIGPELVTLPFATYPKIVHMKRHHAGTQTENWTKELVWEWDHGSLRVQTLAQTGAFHYHVK